MTDCAFKSDMGCRLDNWLKNNCLHLRHWQPCSLKWLHTTGHQCPVGCCVMLGCVQVGSVVWRVTHVYGVFSWLKMIESQIKFSVNWLQLWPASWWLDFWRYPESLCTWMLKETLSRFVVRHENKVCVFLFPSELFKINHIKFKTCYIKQNHICCCIFSFFNDTSLCDPAWKPLPLWGSGFHAGCLVKYHGKYAMTIWFLLYSYTTGREYRRE